MIDVLVAGAGPAGSIAALVLARAGVRVLLVDRDRFPRDKLCGDTLNPGAVRLLASLGLSGGALDRAGRLRGMTVTGPHAAVTTPYGEGHAGLAIRRVDFDAWLLDQAIRAGAHFEDRVIVRRPILERVSNGADVVRGLVLLRRGQHTELRVPASMSIAADGRRSAVARALGLTYHPAKPRRWAFGVYASNVAGVGDFGEMHVRPGHYVGVAGMPDGMTNVCVVTSPSRSSAKPADLVRSIVSQDPALADRMRNAVFESDVRVLGPLAVEARAAGVPGLLLAGDAGGFVDPMTGDGLRLAMQSALLAAEETRAVLESGTTVHAAARLADARRAALGAKLRFNRVVRRFVDLPGSLDVAEVGARVWPGLVRRVVRYAGDLS